MRRHVKTYVLVVAVLIVAAALGFFSADAQQNGAPMQAPGVNNFTQNFLAQHEIGRRFHIDPADLPPPKSGPIVHNGPLIIPYSGRCRRYPRASRRYRLRLGSSSETSPRSAQRRRPGGRTKRRLPHTIAR
jgi:hypothetical protein